MTVFKAQQWAFLLSKDHGKDPSVADLLLQGQLNWSTTEMLMNYQTQLSAEQLERFLLMSNYTAKIGQRNIY